MRFVVLLPVRDEGDIIRQSLCQLLTWADSIYLFDTGSVDETWEIVLELARTEPRIKPMCKEPVFFSETKLRGYMFDVARREMSDGDWFGRVDADEFHHIPPPEFCKTYLGKQETCVYHQYYDFQLTDLDVEAWERAQESLADRARPIADRRRFYKISVYTEPRFCRYRRSMQWPPSNSFPYNAGFVARERIPIRHYPHRDPPQMARRYRLRSIMLSDPTNRKNWARAELHHWCQEEWRKFIIPSGAPGVCNWNPGTQLPRVVFKNHLRRPHVRLLQRLVHGFGLTLLDRLREPFPSDVRPQSIPLDVQDRLKAELGVLP